MKLSKHLLWWPIIFVVAGVTFGLTMAFSIGQSIWFDEGYSILLAKSDWQELFALTAVDAHPPFYYALLKIWSSLFGFNEFALRSLSATMVSAAVVTMLFLIRRVFSTKVALMTLPIIIMAPFLIRYGYEVRMYSTALLIGVAATYALVIAHKSTSWWRWALYAALVALGMYTLYMMVVVWLAHVVWLFLQELKKPRRPLLHWRWLYAYIGAVLLFLPYITTFIYQLLHSALPGIGNEITITSLVDIVTMLLTFTPEWKIGGWLSLLVMAGIIFTVWAGVKTYRYFTKDEKLYYGLFALLTLVPLVFYAITSLPPRDPIFINRYLAHVALFIYAFLAITLALGLTYRYKLKKHRYVSFIAYLLIVALLLIGLVQLKTVGNFVFERLQLPQTQQVRNSLDCSNEVTVVADDPYTYIDSAFYFEGCDMRFYSINPVEKKGGYAPLYDSDNRVNNPLDIASPVLVRLGWNGQKPNFVPDSRYRLANSEVFDKQLVEVYRLIEE